MLFIVSLIFFVVSLSGLGYLLYSRRSLIDNVLDANKVSIESKETKTGILEERIRRKFFGYVSFISDKLKPIVHRFLYYLKITYKKIREKERKYIVEAEKYSYGRKKLDEQKETISEKLDSIDDIPTEDNDEREQAYLDILALDPKNIEAYEGLACLYMEYKQFKEASEIYKYIVSLGEEKVEYFLEWARGLCELGEHAEALKVIINAYNLEPKNPKIIDNIIEIAIISGNKLQARRFLKKLTDVNPDNKKIEEYEEKVNDMS